MQARSGLALGFLGLAALIVLAVWLARLGGTWTDVDRRASTFVTGPGGTSALFEALRALGVAVSRERRRGFVDVQPAADRPTAVALLGPRVGPTAADARTLLALNDAAVPAGLVLAGASDDLILRCFGYRVRLLLIDSVAIDRGRDAAMAAGLHARALLVPLPPDSSRVRGGGGGRGMIALPACPQGRIAARPDTLLASPAGAIALRLSRPAHPDVIVVADEGLFRNETLRNVHGTWAVRMLAREFRAVVFDEFHNGYGRSSSLGRAVLVWSARSPGGWAVWQAALVGVLAILAGAVRFGPPHPVMTRRRRASIEHVRALATALSAAKGHGVAVGLLVQGLRRRLSPRGRQARTSWKEWLDRLQVRATNLRSQEAITRLRSVASNAVNEAAVLEAANAVEDVWDSLRPPTATTSRR